jgi:hypothetical protein
MANNQMIIGFSKCARQHILGQVRQNQHGVAVLALYSQAVDYGQDVPETVDVIAVIESAKAIRCSICGDVSDWHWARPRHAKRVAFE